MQEVVDLEPSIAIKISGLGREKGGNTSKSTKSKSVNLNQDILLVNLEPD